MSRAARGFSLVELLVAVAVFATTAAILFDFLSVSQRVARLEPEAADLNQRVRVAAAAIERDLRAAGGGPVQGTIGTLSNYLPAIIPARTGAVAADAELSAFEDRMSVLYVPDGGWAARLGADIEDVMSDVPIDATAADCPGNGLCGFAQGTRAAIIDSARLGAGHDIFTVTHIAAALGRAAPNPPLSRLYSADTALVVPVEQRAYYLDRPNRRLMLYDGYRSALPLVDNVVDLKFAYFVDPNPSSVAFPADAAGNCVYGAGAPPVALLEPLGATTLAEIPLRDLTDGPSCGVPPNRFDGDLLRIRRVRVTIRLQASIPTVRDFEVTFHVAPRNMSAAR